MLSTYFDTVHAFFNAVAQGPIAPKEMRERYQLLTFFGVVTPEHHVPLTVEQVRYANFDELRTKDPLIAFYIADFRLTWDQEAMNAYIDAVHNHPPFTWEEMVPDVDTYKRLNRTNANTYLNTHIKKKECTPVVEAVHQDIDLWKEAVLGNDMLRDDIRNTYYHHYPHLIMSLFESMAVKGMHRAGNGVRSFFPLQKWLPTMPDSVRDYFYTLYSEVLSGQRSVKNKEWLLSNDNIPLFFLLKESVERQETEQMGEWLRRHQKTVSMTDFIALPLMELPSSWTSLVDKQEIMGLTYTPIPSYSQLANRQSVLWKTFLAGEEQWCKILLCYWFEKMDVDHCPYQERWQEVQTVIDICGGRTQDAIDTLLNNTTIHHTETEIYLA